MHVSLCLKSLKKSRVFEWFFNNEKLEYGKIKTRQHSGNLCFVNPYPVGTESDKPLPQV